MNLSIYIYLLILFLLILIFAKQNSFFNDRARYSSHKTLIYNKKSPVFIGGVYIFLSLVFFANSNYINLIYFSLFILILGLFSDKNIISDPLPRFIIQLIFLVAFIAIIEVSINSISIHYFDKFLNNYYFNLFFTVFCFMVLINGSNFLDGINIIVSGYYFLISIVIVLLSIKFNLDQDLSIFLLFASILFIFIIFNFLGYCLLGDNGSYILPFIFGYLLIEFANNNQKVSEYFIVLLLWYPAFENLFTLLRRKFINNKTLSKPDNLHLHQLIYLFLKSKNIFRLRFVNSFSGMLILLYNLIIFSIGFNYFYHTKNLVLLIVINVLIYCSLYFYLRKKLIFKKK